MKYHFLYKEKEEDIYSKGVNIFAPTIIDAILKFEALTEHPSGSDLIFYPDPEKDGPEFVVKEVKEWRANNGKPGFRIK